MSDEPKRLLLTEEGRLAASLAVARRQGPSDAGLAALAERLVRAGVALPEDIVQGAANPTVPPSAPRARNSSGLMKVALAGVPIVAIALIAGWLLRAKTPPDSGSNAPLAPLQGASPAPARAPLGTTAEAAPQVPNRAPPVAAAPPVAMVPSREPSGNTASVENAARVEPEAPANARPAAPPSEAPARTQAEPRPQPKARSAANEPAPARSAALAAGPTNRDSASDNGSSLPDATPESEIELLKRARNTLPADPARALAITERCADLYPRGNFTQERDFIAISALFRVGRRHEALSRAERFRSSYPKSVYLPQLERMQAAP
jgi:hypothetical protein